MLSFKDTKTSLQDECTHRMVFLLRRVPVMEVSRINHGRMAMRSIIPS